MTKLISISYLYLSILSTIFLSVLTNQTLIPFYLKKFLIKSVRPLINNKTYVRTHVHHLHMKIMLVEHPSSNKYIIKVYKIEAVLLYKFIFTKCLFAILHKNKNFIIVLMVKIYILKVRHVVLFIFTIFHKTVNGMLIYFKKKLKVR